MDMFQLLRCALIPGFFIAVACAVFFARKAWVLGQEILDPWDGFDIPCHRKDIDNVSNARWILRNLAINNATHPRLSEMLDLAIETVKGERN